MNAAARRRRRMEREHATNGQFVCPRAALRGLDEGRQWRSAHSEWSGQAICWPFCLCAGRGRMSSCSRDGAQAECTRDRLEAAGELHTRQTSLAD
eukprot:362928-Chlamydomonas_euryale.AAC.1